MKRGELNKRPPAPVRRTRSVSDTSVRRSILAAMALLGVAAFLVLAGRLVKLMLGIDLPPLRVKLGDGKVHSTSGAPRI